MCGMCRRVVVRFLVQLHILDPRFSVMDLEDKATDTLVVDLLTSLKERMKLADGFNSSTHLKHLSWLFESENGLRSHIESLANIIRGETVNSVLDGAREGQYDLVQGRERAPRRALKGNYIVSPADILKTFTGDCVASTLTVTEFIAVVCHILMHLRLMYVETVYRSG